MRATATLVGSLVEAARGAELASLPPDTVTIAKQCVLDWFGVTLAGAGEELSLAVRAEALELGGSGLASLLGTRLGVSPAAAALANGTAGHALDYDDTNLVMMGHATAPVLPAALAQAEAQAATGSALLEALLAGVEVECRLGLALRPGHYAAGWHPTGTLGAFGAAAATARLLGCDSAQTAAALAIAATQAAGLKAAFGTPGKPLHAGKAALNGLLAGRLARRGFAAGPGLVEGAQGFTETHAPALHLERLEAPGHLIRETLFKYHAACYLTHSTIENTLALRGQGAQPDQVLRGAIAVHPAALRVCDIPTPATGLEGKFSLRATAAMGLLGDATADPAAFSDERMRDSRLVGLRERVTVGGDERLAEAEATLRLELADGRVLESRHDAGEPARDLARQQERLEEKFLRLAGPVLGAGGAERLRGAIAHLEDMPAAELGRLAQPA